MYTIEKEIFSQSEALKLSLNCLRKNKNELATLLAAHDKLVFIGCGSSYMLSAGAASTFSMRTNKKAVALAGGEIMLAPERYASCFEGALVVITSRSGQTSEVLKAIELMRKLADFRLLAITAKDDNAISNQADLAIDMPWIFDESVCQTRTVSNFYLALWYIAVLSQGSGTDEEIEKAVQQLEGYMSAASPVCSKTAENDWKSVVVLADGDVCGVAQEGSLAFCEICMLPGSYYRFLDYRHGPIVLTNKETLVIVLLQGESTYNDDMIRDIKKRGALVLTIGQSSSGSDIHISAPETQDHAAYGLHIITVCQMIAFYKALSKGHNPDKPDGLDPFIQL